MEIRLYSERVLNIIVITVKTGGQLGWDVHMEEMGDFDKYCPDHGH